MYFAQARYYDENIGRFNRVDPIRDGRNWYVYVGNNPVNYVDRDGQLAFAALIPYLVKASIGAVSDILGQMLIGTISNIIAGYDVGTAMEKAFEEINFWQVGASAVLSMFGMPNQVLSAAIEASAGTAASIINGDITTLQGALIDIGVGFVGAMAGELIEQYGKPVLKSALVKLGVDEAKVNKVLGIPSEVSKIGTRISSKVKVIEQDTTLPIWIKESFANGIYETVKTTEDIIVYRVFGGEATANGAFVTKLFSTDKEEIIEKLALLPEWGNSLESLATIKIPKGTVINIGKAGEQISNTGEIFKGGEDQILLPIDWSDD